MLDNSILNQSLLFYKNINSCKIENAIKFSKDEQKNNFCPFKPSSFKVDDLDTFQLYLDFIGKDIRETNSIWLPLLDYNKYFVNLIKLTIIHINNIKKFDLPDKLLISDPRKIFMSIAWLWQDILMRALFSYPIKESNYSLFLNLSYLIIDYYFDDPNVKNDEKKKFSEYVQKRIVANKDHYDLISSKFDKAIKIVEKDFPRNNYNQYIYSTIYDMYMVEKESMQSESLNNNEYSDNDLLSIMAKKGIQTLLTIINIAEFDSKKEITLEQKTFMIKFGFLTQIIDDICDIQNDINSNCKTYFVRMVNERKNSIDNYTYLAINYIYELYDDLLKNNYFKHSSKHNENICKSFYLILNLWLMYGVCKNKSLYSIDCYSDLESYSVLSFEDISSLRNNSKPTLLNLLKNYN